MVHQLWLSCLYWVFPFAVLTLAFLRPDFSQPFFEHAGPEPSSVVVVEPGDTIWALALNIFQGLTHITTQAILSINNLSSALIYPSSIDSRVFRRSTNPEVSCQSGAY